MESYADHRKRDQGSEQASTSGREAASLSGQQGPGKQAATGVWNGPAPQGYRRGQFQQGAQPTPAVAALPEKRDVALPGGHRIPLVGIATGCDDEGAISRALAAGYSLLDVAPGTEAGAAAAVASHPGGRSSLFIAGRLPNDQHRPGDAVAAARALAARFGGYLDLLILDWPVAWAPGSGVGADGAPGGCKPQVDSSVTLRQTWEALSPLVGRAGDSTGSSSGGGPVVRALALGNAGLPDVEEILEAAGTGGKAGVASGEAAAVCVRPAALCVELHPMLPQRKLVGVCLRKGVQSMAALPLAGALPELLQHPSVAKLAQETGKTPEQVVLRWNIQRGIPVVLDLSREPSALSCPAASLFDWALTYEQKALLDALETGKRVLDPEWHTWHDPEAGGAAKPRHMLPPDAVVKGF